VWARHDAKQVGLGGARWGSHRDRSVADIARLLSTEVLLPFDAGWVERVVSILAARGLVTAPAR
jgi:hypothetical protein